ncbi:unnamed protein product [Ambrosiozyma monospora]|uniref:Unnamed protein product n=1 Tax=Ambrosiozyma monospora TaxID=43982 RepID=A0A9W6T5Z5_AMBMO|nr:unnamed protein product [Ambrosiozyma monospora]
MSYPAVSEQFKLITYRNESLTIDDSYMGDQNFDKSALVVNKFDNFISNGSNYKELHKLIFGESLPETNHDDPNSNWKTTLKVILEWAITSNRDSLTNLQRISLISSILKMRINQISLFKHKKSRLLRSDLEIEITEFIYDMSNILTYDRKKYDVTSPSQFDSICLDQLLILISELYSMKLFVVSTYLRRLIASGVIYLIDADKTCYIHLLILNSLPMLNDSNSKNILKRLSTSTGIQLIDKFEVDDMNEEVTLFMNRVLTDTLEETAMDNDNVNYFCWVDYGTNQTYLPFID